MDRETLKHLPCHKAPSHLTFGQQQDVLEHVEHFAGRLVDRGHQGLVLIPSEAAQGCHHLEGERGVQA